MRLAFISLFLVFHQGTTDEVTNNRQPSNLRLMVLPYTNFRPSEPYTYPGPSPTVKIPSKLSEPYLHFSPRPGNSLDFDSLPKWCKSIWDREECGMKCWMLRKICRNIAIQTTMEDTETSPSIAHPMFNYYGYYKKPVPTVSYTKSNMPNMYYAQPSWQYPYHKRPPYYYRQPLPASTPEYGLNPQFTYVDGQQKITTEQSEETTTTEPTTTSTEDPTTPSTTTTAKPLRLKETYPVKVTTLYRYPTDSEVTTLSPHMFEYDQYGKKGYYGDRVYMSAMMPVSGRQQRDTQSADQFKYDDFDEMMFDP